MRLCLFVLVLGGCATLQPYERAALMTTVMQDPGDPTAAGARAHVFDTRESMAGATTTGGAPCGCN